MTIEHLNKMAACRHLLDAPAPEVVGELIAEIHRLRARIEDVIKRPDYTNPEGMVRRLREALANSV